MTIQDILGHRRTWANGPILLLRPSLMHQRSSRFLSEVASRADHTGLPNAVQEQPAAAWWARARVQLAVVLHRIVHPPPSYLPGWRAAEHRSGNAGFVTVRWDESSQVAALADWHENAARSKAESGDLPTGYDTRQGMIASGSGNATASCPLFIRGDDPAIEPDCRGASAVQIRDTGTGPPGLSGAGGQWRSGSSSRRAAGAQRGGAWPAGARCRDRDRAVGNLRALFRDDHAAIGGERDGGGASARTAAVPADYRRHRTTPQFRRPFDRASAQPTGADVDAAATSRRHSSVIEEQRRWWRSRGGRHRGIARGCETSARHEDHLGTDGSLLGGLLARSRARGGPCRNLNAEGLTSSGTAKHRSKLSVCRWCHLGLRPLPRTRFILRKLIIGCRTPASTLACSSTNTSGSSGGPRVCCLRVPASADAFRSEGTRAARSTRFARLEPQSGRALTRRHRFNGSASQTSVTSTLRSGIVACNNALRMALHSVETESVGPEFWTNRASA